MKHPGKFNILIPAFLVIASMLLSGGALAGVRTQVVVNKSVLVNLNNPVQRISIARPEIADMLLISPRQIQIIGMAIGSTSLIVWEKGGGKPLFFDVNVTSDESLLKEIASRDDISVSYAKDTVILSGKAANQQTIDKLVQVAKAYSPNVMNHISIDNVQQVLLQIKVAQVDKSALKNLGVSFMVKNKNGEGFSNMIGSPNGSIGSAIASAVGNFSPLDAYTMGITHFPSGISAVLKALSTKGLAKILAEPNLVVKSGQKGEFFAGSEIPFSVLQSTGGSSTPSIVYKSVGIKLNFNPVVMENGVIALEINPAEVSNVQGVLAVNGYPIIDTRTIKTFAELKDGESLILAGLLQEETIKSISKVPLLGDIPVLGALFRTTDDELKEKELVFFITPTIVKPQLPGTKVDLPTDKPLTPEQEREMQWIPMGK
jgi:pilus assembly protein CpaC